VILAAKIVFVQYVTDDRQIVGKHFFAERDIRQDDACAGFLVPVNPRLTLLRASISSKNRLGTTHFTDQLKPPVCRGTYRPRIIGEDERKREE
jgi:hypothetical protein